jgi:hypothetical protein
MPAVNGQLAANRVTAERRVRGDAASTSAAASPLA